MRLLMLGLAPLVLSSCVVRNMDSSDYRYVNYVQTFQKIGQQGHTDSEQRKKDLYSCGVERRINIDNSNWSGASAKPGETLQQIVERGNKLESCMEGKGYIVYGYDKCGPLKSPTDPVNNSV